MITSPNIPVPRGSLVGLTTTVPVEVILAAGCVPVDLNNIFITDNDPERFLAIAESAGYPRNMCNWTKGLYGVMMERPDISVVVSVVRGDCSNTQALMETLQAKNVATIPFAYPYERTVSELSREMNRFRERFAVSEDKVNEFWQRLASIRQKLVRLDDLTWKSGIIPGCMNHYFLVNSSDFNGDPDCYEHELDTFLQSLPSAPENDLERVDHDEHLRLGYIGVPPIITDLYEFLEYHEARVVFNEVQRQFSMPWICSDIVEQYCRFTYPYDIFSRLEDIRAEIKRRRIQGVIHYTQSFCFRQVEDIIVRQELDVPILTLEGERPSPLDERTKIRLETFLDVLRSQHDE